MEKIIQYTTTLTVIVFFCLVFFSCNSKNNSPFSFIENNEIIEDSLSMFKEKYNQDFLIYYYKENDQYIEITFGFVEKPYELTYEYDYKKLMV